MRRENGIIGIISVSAEIASGGAAHRIESSGVVYDGSSGGVCIRQRFLLLRVRRNDESVAMLVYYYNSLVLYSSPTF